MLLVGTISLPYWVHTLSKINLKTLEQIKEH